jgi:hypothetical protein
MSYKLWLFAMLAWVLTQSAAATAKPWQCHDVYHKPSCLMICKASTGQIITLPAPVSLCAKPVR